ncbi:hypothetical protein [Candidatus Poriferisodalis sp.]|uniref:hypothetical protein n=1 Tax=Candidatus Poriferisodalis sp. TaxID=3101277 RepID=UPI003B02ECD5
MAGDSDPMIPDDLIEEYLRFLREGGPEPDLAGLDEDLSNAAEGAFRVLEALVDATPGSPPLERDPVAIRLGLVGAPTGAPLQASADRDDPVTAAVAEVERRFSVACTPAATDGTEFERRFECRSMVENVLIVVVPEGTSRAAMSAHARSAFALAEDLSAVAYTTTVGTESAVLTYAESHRMLDPASGWADSPAVSDGEPLEIALGRYLERSDPRWGAIQGLDMSDVLGGIDSDVVAIVQEVKQELASTRPRLEHRKEARAFVLGCDDEMFIDWARRVQRRSASGEDVQAEIESLFEARS